MKLHSNTKISLSIVTSSINNDKAFFNPVRVCEALDFSKTVHFMEHTELDSKSSCKVSNLEMIDLEDREGYKKIKMTIEMSQSNLKRLSNQSFKDKIKTILMDFISFFDKNNLHISSSNMTCLFYNGEISEDNENQYVVSDVTRDIEYVLFRDSESYNILDFENIQKDFDRDLSEGISGEDLMGYMGNSLRDFLDSPLNDEEDDDEDNDK